MDEHFFQQNGLREFGWCSHYMLNIRTLNYHNHKFLKKTEIVEFYWFIGFYWFHNQQTITEAKLCNCMYCKFFIFEKKMTFANVQPMSFGKIFEYFFRY